MARWFEAVGRLWRGAGWPVAAVRKARSILSGRLGAACLVALHALVVYTLCGFFLVPPVAKAMLEGRLATKLGRPVSVERIRFNPLTFDLIVDGFIMREPGGAKVFVSFEHFEVNLDPSELVASRVAVDRLLVQKPFVRLARDEKGRLNIADLLPEPQAEDQAASNARAQDARTEKTPDRDAQGGGSQPEASQDRTPSPSDRKADSRPQGDGQPSGAPPTASENQASPPAGQSRQASAQEGPRTVIFARPGLGFRLRDVLLADGGVLFEDALTGSSQELTALHFGIKSLTSDEPGLRDLFSSGGVINKSSVQLTVKADPFGPAPEAKVRLSVKDVDLKPYAPYLKTADNLEFHLDRIGVLAGVRFPHLAQGDRSPVVDVDARLDGLQLAVEGNPAFGLESMSVHGAELDLGAPGLTVEQVEISSPTLRFVRDENGRTTLDALLESVDLPQEQSKQPAPPFGVKVAQVEVKNGLATLKDKGLGLEASVEGLRLDLADFDLGAGRLGKLTLKGQGSHFESLDCAVSGGFSPLDLSGSLSLDGVDLTKPGPVLRRLLPNLVLAGKAQGKASFQVGEKAGSPTGKITADVSASDLSLSGTGGDKPLVVLRGLRLGGVQTDLAGKSVNVDKVEVRDAGLRLVRDQAGDFTLERLFSTSPGGSGAAAKPRTASGGSASDQGAAASTAQAVEQSPGAKDQGSAEAKPGGYKNAKSAKGGNAAGQGASSGAGRYAVRELAASGLTVDYQADTAAKPAQVRFDSLSVRGAGFPLAAPVEFDAKGQAFAKGSFSVSGRADPVGHNGAVKLNLAGLSLPDAARLVPGLPVTVAGGLLTLSGELSSSFSDPSPSARYVGDVGLSGISVTAPGQTAPLLGLTDFSARGIDCAWPSAVVKAKSVSLTAPALVLTLDKDGKPVLPGEAATGKPAAAKTGATKAQTAKKEAAHAAKSKAPAKGEARAEAKDQASLTLDLGEFTLQKGRLDVSFLGVNPPARLDLSDLNVQAKPVKTGQPGQLTLSTVVGNAGRLSGQGQAGWVGGEPMLDLKAKLDNLDLTELSSVSRQFTGFPITRGKLGLTLDYKAGKKLFDLKNRVVVLGIQLGPKARVAGGKDIPLDLAVSLLTDSNGVITMDIPVSGDTDNLKVDLSGVISSAMAGAFTKILFSPLAFLNVAKTDGRTAPVPFEPGTAQLTPEGAKTLTELAQALAQRPRLNLELSSYVDTATETGAFSVALAEGHSGHDGTEPAPGKAKPGKGKAGEETSPAKEPPTPAQAQTVMPLPDDWRRLAANRLEAARRYLVDVAKLSESRVFTMTADPFKPPKIKGVSGARVDASLKY
ncbi:hypothetical protein JCM15519_27820 [Fundidesulfovibrio butyratiphilus]